MKTTVRSNFTTVKTEGALLPPDLLQKIADGKVAGLQPQDYHLGPKERLNEAINRAWNRLLGIWQDFRQQMESLPASDNGFTLTRRRWLEILFQELGYGRLHFQRSFDLPSIAGSEDQTSQQYPINYRWEHVPILLTSFRQELDKRDPALKRSPHSLLQEFLNRSSDHQWGFVSNGLALRILRDNASLTRPAYVEFDLDAMLTGEQYADFSLLWLLCHQSRMEKGGSREEEVESSDVTEEEDAVLPSPVAALTLCWLERWSQSAVEEGTRALDALRNGVQAAIEALGQGFLRQSANRDLKAALQQGDLSTQEYYRQLLRMVYRLIFLLVAEDRALLLTPNTPPAIQDRYICYYSVGRLRALAEARRGSPHPDLYRGLRLLFAQLRDGYAPLGLPALGSFLFSDKATPALDEADLANYDLLNALRALTFTTQGSVRRAVDYKNLGAEELGSVYESLLELHPQINVDAATFALSSGGSERKTTGSYYTPTSLITCLLDSALEPVIAMRIAECRMRNAAADGRQNSALEQAILAIKVVDPACGSGHFLIAAANRLALHLARVRTGDNEPSPTDRRAALREVVHHCIHGVDINPMAVELCKVALWMETLDPGRPLGFLDRNIQCGNSLLGATPALLRRGIPDDAFTPILGDNKEYVSRFKKQNKQERSGQRGFDTGDFGPWRKLGKLAEQMHYLTSVGDETVDDVRFQEEYYAEVSNSPEYRASRLWADAWCAAFVWVKKAAAEGGFAFPITEQTFRTIETQPERCAAWMVTEIERLHNQYQFFHWHLAFPDIFQARQDELEENDVTGWTGGFDVVLGNPPWERVKIQEKEWFATRDPAIASARNTSERREMIADLGKINPELLSEFELDKRKAEGENHLIRVSGRYPLCGRGDFNTYAIFAELNATTISYSGRAGFIVQTSIATSDTSKEYFENLLVRNHLISIFDFDNRRKIFPSVQGNIRFCLMTISQQGQERFVMAAQLEHPELLKDKGRIYELTVDDIRRMNPNTMTCPTFKTKQDAEIVKRIYQRIPVLIQESPVEKNPWRARFFTVFHMSGASEDFRTLEALQSKGAILRSNKFLLHNQQYLPVYESKLTNQFNHRANTFEGIPDKDRFKIHAGTKDVSTEKLSDPAYDILPRYWVKETVLNKEHDGIPFFFSFRRSISAVADSRSVTATIIPKYGVGDSLFLIESEVADFYNIALGAMNSFIFDYVLRQKASGGNLSFYIAKQLPFLSPDHVVDHICTWLGSSAIEWISPRILELSFTSYSLKKYAEQLNYYGPPFRWEADRRFLLRCELDAAYFHLYGIARDDVDYIMETFPIVKRKDIAAHGEFRTKRVILEIYDEMAVAMRTGQPYQTRLDPPPAAAASAHPWDEQYLGPVQEPATWWREVAVSATPGAEEITYATNAKALGQPVRESRATYTVSPPATPPETPAAMQLGFGFSPKVWPAPRGDTQTRRARLLALSTPNNGATTEDNLREVTAFLADPQPDLRALAGQLLRQQSSPLLIAILDDFLSEAEAARLAIAKPEINRLLHSIVEMAKEESVRRSAQTLLARTAG